MTLVTLKEKGQVTIPAAVRLELAAQKGDVFEVTVAEGNIVLRPRELVPRVCAAPRGVDIGTWIGKGKGLFANAEEADRFIRSERARWE